MSTNPPSWYLPGEGKKPVGPFTTEQIIESLQVGRLDEKTLCWQEGMAKWLALAEVDPFASTIRYATINPGRRSIFRQLVGWLVVLLILVVAGAAGYVYWNEWTTIGEVNTLIAAENYERALAVLRSFRNETHFYHGEATYLSALAAIRQFASAANTEDLGGDGLRKPKRQLQGLFQASESWRDRAKLDLVEIIGSVPGKAADALARSMAIAAFMEKLKLADAKQLSRTTSRRTEERNRQTSPFGQYGRRHRDTDSSLGPGVGEKSRRSGTLHRGRAPTGAAGNQSLGRKCALPC